MYDPRHSFKAQAGEVLSMGESLWLATDGKVYAIDNEGGKNVVCHGWALEDAAEDDWITVVTYCRMTTDATETIGARVGVGAVSGGSAPSTTLAAPYVGFALTTSTLMLHTTFPPPAAGPAKSS